MLVFLTNVVTNSQSSYVFCLLLSISEMTQRDEVGIGGSWSEFLVYLRAALVSDNVKLVFSGPASAVDGHGASSTIYH